MKINSKFIAVILCVLFSPLITKAQSDEIIVLSGSEDAEGVTQTDFNLELLQAVELRTKTIIKEKAEAYLKSQGMKMQRVDVQSSAVYVQFQHMKLAIVRISASGSEQVHIFGIRGKELLRVACINQTGATIPISYGKCGDKIREVYKIDISKGSN